jgi:hypothetical protein
MSPSRTRPNHRHHDRKSKFGLSHSLIILIIVVQLAMYFGAFDPPKNVKQSQATTTTPKEQNTFQVSEARKQTEFGPRDAPMSRISYGDSSNSGNDGDSSGVVGEHVDDDVFEGEGGGDRDDDDENEVEEGDSEEGEDEADDDEEDEADDDEEDEADDDEEKDEADDDEADDDEEKEGSDDDEEKEESDEDEEEEESD